MICAQVHAVSDKGEKRWSTDLGHPVMAEPVLDGEGTLYVGNDDGKVYALDAKKGKILWSHVFCRVRGAFASTAWRLMPHQHAIAANRASILTAVVHRTSATR